MEMVERKQNSIFGIAFSDKTRKILNISFKVLGVLLGLAFMWGTLSRPYIEQSIYNLQEVTPNAFGRIIIVVLKYCTNASILIAMTAPFFFFRTTDKIVRYANPVVVILRLLLSANLIQVAQGPSGSNQFFKAEQFYVELALLAAISIFAWVMFLFEGRPRTDIKTHAKKAGLAVATYILIGFINIPFSFLLGIFGPSNVKAIDFSLAHRLIIYACFVVPFIVMMIFKNKSYKLRWYVCLQAALAAFFMFYRLNDFNSFKDITGWPLHLCNAGITIILIAFIFRLKAAFYFGYLINILGAFIAIVIPDKMGDIFYWNSIHYWHEHLADVIIPMVGVGLGIFARPKFKYVLYAILGFTVYFLVVAYVDAKYYYKGVDFFFLNSNKFSDYFKSFERIRTDVVWKISISGGNGTMIIRWLYWLLIYLVYVALAFAMWFLYSLVFRISDSHIDCHNKMIKKKEIAKQRKILLAQQKEELKND